jgi:ATP-binding protein involved in chromosome partitioning
MADDQLRAAALAALDKVPDPKTGLGLAAAGFVQGLVVREGRVSFMLEVPSEDAAEYGPVRDAAERALRALPWVVKAQVVLTAAARARPGGARVRKGAASVTRDPHAQLRPVGEAEKAPHVKRVVAVASGKGGVGKSTVAVNLACAFAAEGLRAGVLDADVYGPSAPRMLGVDEELEFDDGKLKPLSAHGLKVMSIGFIVGEDEAMIWRGPMASSAVRQMIADVRWGTEAEPLDVLVVDLPPGTGDIPLTLVQKLKLDGVVIVSTPQEIALVDVRRAAAMFKKTGTPILGVIENMAFFPDPSTGAPIEIFGRGGARAEAARLQVPLLAEVPIDIALREGGDAGRPIVVSQPESAVAQAFRAAAKALL